jgi:hypothetical protein
MPLKVHQSSPVFRKREYFDFKQPHLTCCDCYVVNCSAADHLPHCRINGKTVGVIRTFVTGKATKND